MLPTCITWRTSDCNPTDPYTDDGARHGPRAVLFRQNRARRLIKQLFQWLKKKSPKRGRCWGRPHPEPCAGAQDFDGPQSSQNPLIYGLQIGAPQHRFCQVWRFAKPHLYIEGAKRRRVAGICIHRALKKTAFLAILAFDRLGPRTYNPRPRCFAADVAKR